MELRECFEEATHKFYMAELLLERAQDAFAPDDEPRKRLKEAEEKYRLAKSLMEARAREV